MPHYFFDTSNGETWITDKDGLDCDHHDAAREHAHAALADIAKDELPDGSERIMVVRVRDGDGPLLEAYLDLQTFWLR